MVYDLEEFHFAVSGSLLLTIFVFAEPAYYKKRDDFGIRLANVLEVVDTARRHPSGAKFLALNDITLVPYEPKLIETSLLSAQEVSIFVLYIVG